MGNFFIAVGGTGQGVALAYLKLAKMCGFKPAEIFVLDADDRSPITNNLSDEGTITKISPIPAGVGNNTTLEEPFRVNDADMQRKIDAVLSVLLSDEERRTQVSSGMYRRPSAGAIALMIMIMENGLTQLTDQIQDNSIVTICGSVIGGTGAGGVPTLAKYIKTKAKQTDKDVKIVIIDFLRWFSVTGDDENNIDNDFRRNSDSVLFYLGDKITSDIDGCVLLGLNNPLLVNNQPIGQQKEKRHLINLLAAIIANNAFHCSNIQNLFPNRETIYTYVVPDNGLKLSDVDVILPSKKSVTLGTIIKKVKYIEKYLLFFKNYIQGGLPGFSFTPGYVVPTNLKKVILNLSENSNKSKGENTICDEIAKVIEREEERRGERIKTGVRVYYEKLIQWYDELCVDSNSSAEFKFATSGEKELNIKIYHPMLFFRELFNNVDNNRIKEDFDKEMVKGLRRTINENYLKNVFDDMKFLTTS